MYTIPTMARATVCTDSRSVNAHFSHWSIASMHPRIKGTRMRLLLSLALVCWASLAFAQTQNPAVITPKHIELPSRYENLARSARLQGTITVQLTISGDGKVIAAEPSSTDAELKAHPILQAKTAELTRRWTFTCSSCSKDSRHTYVVTFIYKLDGKESAYDDTRIAVDWPDHVTITANPPIVNGD
jgi:hypothetical protein